MVQQEDKDVERDQSIGNVRCSSGRIVIAKWNHECLNHVISVWLQSLSATGNKPSLIADKSAIMFTGRVFFRNLGSHSPTYATAKFASILLSGRNVVVDGDFKRNSWDIGSHLKRSCKDVTLRTVRQSVAASKR